jgi:hypothetical protein
MLGCLTRRQARKAYHQNEDGLENTAFRICEARSIQGTKRNELLGAAVGIIWQHEQWVVPKANQSSSTGWGPELAGPQRSKSNSSGNTNQLPQIHWSTWPWTTITASIQSNSGAQPSYWVWSGCRGETGSTIKHKEGLTPAEHSHTVYTNRSRRLQETAVLCKQFLRWNWSTHVKCVPFFFLTKLQQFCNSTRQPWDLSTLSQYTIASSPVKDRGRRRQCSLAKSTPLFLPSNPHFFSKLDRSQSSKQWNRIFPIKNLLQL